MGVVISLEPSEMRALKATEPESLREMEAKMVALPVRPGAGWP